MKQNTETSSYLDSECKYIYIIFLYIFVVFYHRNNKIFISSKRYSE